MRYLGYILLYLVGLTLAIVPLYQITSSGGLPFLTPSVVALINLLGWCGVLVFVLSRIEFRRKVHRIALSLGIETRFKSFETLLTSLIREVSRKNDAFEINLIDRKISSKQELSRVLENITAQALRLLEAESAELALFDPSSGMYHSSFVLGRPFRSSAQAMLSNALEGNKELLDPDVLVHPITFAGNILGSLRVGLKSGTLPTANDQEVLKLLSLQGGLAIINSEFTEKLLNMKRASEESIKAKTGFLANLSHEIRGPLGIMINAVELVLDGLCGSVTPDQAETLGMIKQNGEHLLELINDVLDYAKVESGRIVPQKVDMLVEDLLKDIVGVVRAQAEAKKHKLTFKGNSEAFALNCDRRHIRQMLINLLTNAIKYTPDGGTIEVWAERVPGNKIRLNVKDSGIGIEEANRYKVFAAFERIDNSYAINQVGTGLGMPLTKRLAEVNGGLVDFRSSPGKGSHFWLLFPAVEYNPTALIDKESKPKEARGKGESVVLIERDPGEQKMISRYLTHLGFKVLSATSRLEALEVLRSAAADLLIIDNNITDNPNENILEGVREASARPKIPILLITSRGFSFDIEKYLRSGIDRCLIKPLELPQLGMVCRQLIDGTYTGAVVDGGLMPGKPAGASGERQDSDVEIRTRMLELDDILH